MMSIGMPVAGGIGATVVFSAIIATCLTLASIYGLVWLKRRDAWANVMFSLLAIGTAGMAGCELGMMRSVSTEAFGAVLRGYQVAVWVTILGYVGFVHSYLKTDRVWLGRLVIGVRTLTLFPNFIGGAVSVNYREITSLVRIPFLGEVVSVPVGVPNPWMVLAQFSLFLLLAYVTDATVTCWRLGDRRRAVTVGGGLMLFTCVGILQSILVFWGLVRMPLSASVFFLGMVLVMGFELIRDVLNAAALSKELQREKALTDAVFDGVPGVIYLYTQEGRLVRWNRKHEEMTGYTPEELSRMTVADWYDSADYHRVANEIGRVFETGQGRVEAHIIVKGGRKIPYLLTGVRLDIDGKPHLVGIGIDLSGQRRMERELEAQRRELAHMSRVSAMGVLSASIAHELNQPLTAILSNAQAGQRFLAAPDPDLAEVREILKDIATEDVRAGNVIRGLRAMMKNEPPRRERLDANRVIETVVSLLHAESELRNVALEKRLAADLPNILGDQVQLQQVVLNLLMNALESTDALPPGSGRIEVCTDAAEGWARIRVNDNGLGIPPEQLAGIFEPFVTTKSAGMGMGLSVCRSIVKANGGSIRAENNPVGGATFTVMLPTYLSSGSAA